MPRVCLQFVNVEENQAGFRSGYSTTDHIFTLHALTEILKSRNKKLFCAYIDFQKALTQYGGLVCG